MGLAVGEGPTKGCKQLVLDSWVALHQILARCDHVLDYLIETVKLSPRFTVGVKTPHAIGHFAAEEKMIEQHDGVNLATPKHIKELLLPVGFPAQSAIVHSVDAAQKITVNRVSTLVRRDQTASKILRLLHGAVAANEHPIALHR